MPISTNIRLGRKEAACAISQTNRHSVIFVVNYCEILIAVSIEIPNCQVSGIANHHIGFVSKATGSIA
jgi:hypothetical protein